jgi:hypothetical protein
MIIWAENDVLYGINLVGYNSSHKVYVFKCFFRQDSIPNIAINVGIKIEQRQSAQIILLLKILAELTYIKLIIAPNKNVIAGRLNNDILICLFIFRRRRF